MRTTMVIAALVVTAGCPGKTHHERPSTQYTSRLSPDAAAVARRMSEGYCARLFRCCDITTIRELHTTTEDREGVGVPAPELSEPDRTVTVWDQESCRARVSETLAEWLQQDLEPVLAAGHAVVHVDRLDACVSAMAVDGCLPLEHHLATFMVYQVNEYCPGVIEGTQADGASCRTTAGWDPSCQSGYCTEDGACAPDPDDAPSEPHAVCGPDAAY